MNTTKLPSLGPSHYHLRSHENQLLGNWVDELLATSESKPLRMHSSEFIVQSLTRFNKKKMIRDQVDCVLGTI